MSLHVTLDLGENVSAAMNSLAVELRNPTGMYARIAGDAERFVKERGRLTALTEHRTAETLGAQPTGHLSEAYEGIESISDADAATLLVPSASRLRAAFGSYVLTPKNGSQYLTIPVAAPAYGHRAREFDDLFFMRVGITGTPVLARRVSAEAKRFTQAEVMYVLVTESTIPEDRGLIPFDDLADEAADSAMEYIDDALAGTIKRRMA